MRQCIGCRESRSKNELIRIVKTEDEQTHEIRICVDRTGKVNGRGAYLCDDPACLKKARKNNGLSRSFRMQVSAEIYDELERQLGK